MMEQKRRPALLLDHGSIISSTVKRQKKEACLSTKERKDKVGERVAALQQLVSPFGKTDTASVLCEAMEYIKFLHDQLKALSAPYLLSTPTGEFPDSQQQFGLRSQGLCLVPISCTLGIARSNGADIWAPIKHTSPTI